MKAQNRNKNKNKKHVISRTIVSTRDQKVSRAPFVSGRHLRRLLSISQLGSGLLQEFLRFVSVLSYRKDARHLVKNTQGVNTRSFFLTLKMKINRSLHFRPEAACTCDPVRIFLQCRVPLCPAYIANYPCKYLIHTTLVFRDRVEWKPRTDHLQIIPKYNIFQCRQIDPSSV